MNEQINKLQRDIRLLKAYALFVTALFGVLWLSGFTQTSNKQKFEEIDVERINVVEKDGRLRFVLTSSGRDTTERAHGKRYAAFLFYNDEGRESGALSSYGRKNEDGSYNATSRLVFDQFDNDETIAMQYTDENGQRLAGLLVWDRPEAPMTDEIREQIRAMWRMPDGPGKWQTLEKLRAQRVFETYRMFVGKHTDKSSVISMFDRNGQNRLRLKVDSLGQPSLTFYDEKGRPTLKLPDSLSVSQKK
jgi:hypothetical protein